MPELPMKCEVCLQLLEEYIDGDEVTVGLIGYLLEVCLIRFLYGRPLDTLLATWGVSMIIQQTVLIVSRQYDAACRSGAK